MENKPTMNDDNIIANQLAGMSLEEAIFQHGYSSGYEYGKREATGPRWVKGTRNFPVKKPVVAKKYISYLNKEVVGAASSATGEMICFDWGVSSVCLAIDHEELNDLYWLDEQPAAGREEDAAAIAEELWDNHSVLIGEDIFTLEQYANREVMKKDDFMKAVAAFKQHNP